MIPFSVLDLAPVAEGSTPADALRNSRDLAQHAERLGYQRFWLAEHHGMAGIASAATAVVIGHVAAGTRTIRVGSGGVMLPNHAPLILAEQIGTLASLFPGRIDLGLRRAPRSAHNRRAIRPPRLAVPGPHRSRPRPPARHRSVHGPRTPSRSQRASGAIPTRRTRAAGVLRTRLTRSADPCCARRRSEGADLAA